jgi:hypothetical protein
VKNYQKYCGSEKDETKYQPGERQPSMPPTPNLTSLPKTRPGDLFNLHLTK